MRFGSTDMLSLVFPEILRVVPFRFQFRFGICTGYSKFHSVNFSCLSDFLSLHFFFPLRKSEAFYGSIRICIKNNPCTDLSDKKTVFGFC